MEVVTRGAAGQTASQEDWHDVGTSLVGEPESAQPITNRIVVERAWLDADPHRSNESVLRERLGEHLKGPVSLVYSKDLGDEYSAAVGEAFPGDTLWKTLAYLTALVDTPSVMFELEYLRREAPTSGTLLEAPMGCGREDWVHYSPGWSKEFSVRSGKHSWERRAHVDGVDLYTPPKLEMREEGQSAEARTWTPSRI
jgi:hypothetical protein